MDMPNYGNFSKKIGRGKDVSFINRWLSEQGEFQIFINETSLPRGYWEVTMRPINVFIQFEELFFSGWSHENCFEKREKNRAGVSPYTAYSLKEKFSSQSLTMEGPGNTLHDCGSVCTARLQAYFLNSLCKFSNAFFRPLKKGIFG